MSFAELVGISVGMGEDYTQYSIIGESEYTNVQYIVDLIFKIN